MEVGKSKILILGAKGMLGQALAQTFADHGPILWDKEDIDVTDVEKTNKKITALRPGVVINCVAMTDVDACESNPELAQKLNAETVGTLANLCSKMDAVLVQYSTSYVFDGIKQGGYTEEDDPNPINIYGATKLAGEEKAIQTQKHYILRLDRLFGRAGGGKKSFVEKIMEAAKGKSQLEVVDEELGSPTYAPDLAARTKEILEKARPFGLYHCANQGSCTWYGFAKEIFKTSEIDVKLKPVSSGSFPRPARRPANSALATAKLSPMRIWEEALADFLTK